MYNCETHLKIDMNDLTITQRKESDSGFNMFTSNPFFKNKKEVVISFDEWGVYFRTPSIDDDKTINIHKNGLKSYQISIYNIDVKSGVLLYSQEESNEDEVCFFYL